eukprot:jgi/Mesvir1/26510/Mv16167-RA.2
MSKSYANLMDLANPRSPRLTNTPSRRERLSMEGMQEALDAEHSDNATDDSTSTGFNGKLIVVANTLPLHCKRTPDGSSWEFEWDQDALVAQVKESMGSEMEVVYIGLLPVQVEVKLQDAVAAYVQSTFNCYPIFITDDVRHRYYSCMCKQYLWNLFHYMMPLMNQSLLFDRNHWQAYLATNKKMCDKVMEVNNPWVDYVWVHDYHLMVLSTFLRKRFNNMKIGFFLHIPFPSSEMYRTCPVREEILRSMLNCDIIGFHTFDYARHFLSCCSRMLGLEFETKRGQIVLEYYGREINVKIRPAGVNVERLVGGFEWPECQWRLGELKSQYEGRTVLVGVDDADAFKGVELKLQAIEYLLEERPEWVGKLVLVQVINPPKMARGNEEKVREVLKLTSERINQRYRKHDYEPVVLLDRHVPLHERIAIYNISECAIVTSVRDGLNLVPYEYIVCRQGQDKALERCNSMLVVSEFAGCSPSFSGAVRINPWHFEGTSDAIHRALTLPLAERQSRHQRHYNYILNHTVGYWVKSFTQDLKRTCHMHERLKCYALGFGMGFRVVALKPNFRKLELNDILPAYVRSMKRAIFLDYDGTVTPTSNFVQQSPSPAVIDALTKLSSDPRNFLFIISGRKRSILVDWLGGIPNLGLCAEHGFYYRLAGDQPWTELHQMHDFGWKESALPILEQYMESTDGSYIEEKDSAVVWHYAAADPAFGSWQAKELLDHLESVLVNEPVDVVQGQGIVEVKPKGVSKGQAVQYILRKLATMGSYDGKPDMVLCIGDDRSDEDMFQQVEALSGSQAHVEVFACTVGPKPSKAKFYLNDTAEVSAACWLFGWATCSEDKA